MKYIKIIAVLGLVLAVASTASATGIPFRTAWAGPVFMHLHGYTTGTVYSGTYIDGTFGAKAVFNGTNWYNPATHVYDPALVTSPAYDATKLVVLLPGKATNSTLNANGTQTGEEGWSVFQIDEIFKGSLTGVNSITPIDVTHPLYLTGDINPTFGTASELVGAVFGGHDLNVQFNTTDLLTTTIESTGWQTQVWLQDDGTWNQGTAGTAGRVANGAFFQDKYATLGYTAAGAVNAAAHAELVDTANGQVGFYGTDPLAEQVSVFTSVGSSGSGTADIFLSVGPITAAHNSPGGSLTGDGIAQFDSNIFVPNKSGFATSSADFRLHVTNTVVTQTSTFDWLVSFSDPLTADVPGVIPEPLTMLAVLLSAGGLAGYLRRRTA